MTSIYVIPDMQVKPGVDLDYCSWIGNYIVHQRPNIVVNLGDFADFPSLSSYDKGKLQFEGRRYKEDLKAARQGMQLLLQPLRELQAKQRVQKDKLYNPRLVMCLGNHEQRVLRLAENNPELDGLMGYEDLPYQDWEVHDFLKPVEIEGIQFVHYLANPYTGKPYGGTAANQLSKARKSFICGHKQILDIHTSFSLDGVQQWGIVAGSSYPHSEPYKGYQGNPHWRGCLYLHRVKDGNFDLMTMSLDFLRDKYNSRL